MTLWIAMAVLAAAVSLSVLVPLYRGRAGARRMAEQEVSVYRDQLDEVERDLEPRRRCAAEAEAARTEIARRLIRADSGRQAAGTLTGQRDAAAHRGSGGRRSPCRSSRSASSLASARRTCPTRRSPPGFRRLPRRRTSRC